jgi:Holliday junction DNA helicase RuvA
MACKELGFKEDKVIPIAQKILSANHITKPEQLIHLVLKEI